MVNNIVDISKRKKDNDKEKYKEILVKAVELASILADSSLYETEIKLHFCEELNTLVDHTKKKIERECK